MRRLNSIAFLMVHVIGTLLAFTTLLEVWRLQLLLDLLISRSLIFRVLGVPPAASSQIFWGILMGTTLTTLAALWAIRKTIWRYRHKQAEPEPALRLRLLIYFAAACVSMNVIVFSTPEAFSGPFRIRFPILANLFATAVYAIWLRKSARLERRGPIDSKPKRRKLDLLCMNIVLVLILTEISLNIVTAIVPIPILITNESSSKIRRNAERQAPDALRFGFPMNSEGHYDSEFVPKSQVAGPLVLNIGDSFSYGTVPHSYHYTTVAERLSPGVEIYNMGYPGTGPNDYTYMLEDAAPKLDPDLVVIQLFVGNDIAASAPRPQKPRWHDADRYQLGILWHRLAIVRNAERTHWAKDAEPAGESADPAEPLYPWLTDPFLEVASLGEKIFLSLESRNAETVCTDNPAIYGNFFTVLDDLIRRSNGVPLAFVIIPDEFQVKDKLWDEVRERIDVPLERDLPQRKIVEWMKARGYPVLDLLPAFQKVEPLKDGQPHLYHLQDTHFNARGNEVAGRELARFIVPLLAEDSPQRLQEPLPFQIVISDTASDPWMESGWQNRELEFAWSDGAQSTLLTPVGNNTDLEMLIDCMPFSPPDSAPQRITIFVNDKEIKEIELRPGRNTYPVTLPRELLGRWRNRIAFRYAHVRIPRDVLPDSADERELAVAWYQIRFSEKGKDDSIQTAP